MFKWLMKSEFNFDPYYVKDLCENKTVTQVCFLLLLEVYF